MLTLSSISQRIEQLEEEEYLSTNAQLETWRSMVQWQYWLNSLPDKDNWRKDFEALPKEHEVRQLYNSLMWFTGRFADVLPNNVTWLAEKSGIAFECWIEEAISEGYTESALCCEEAMTDAIQFVAECLTNGSLDRIDELKRQEAEQWELKLKYRRQAHEGSILPEGIKWLEEYDAAFLENFTAKKQSEVKPVTSETVKKLESNQLVTLPEAPKPIEIIQPVTDGPVTVKYLGGWRGFQVTTTSGMRSIEPGDEVLLPPFVWENIQNSNMPKSWWIRL